MLSHKMTPLHPFETVDHFSFLREWQSELRLFAKGAAVGAIFGAILWLGNLLMTL